MNAEHTWHAMVGVAGSAPPMATDRGSGIAPRQGGSGMARPVAPVRRAPGPRYLRRGLGLPGATDGAVLAAVEDGALVSWRFAVDYVAGMLLMDDPSWWYWNNPGLAQCEAYALATVAVCRTRAEAQLYDAVARGVLALDRSYAFEEEPTLPSPRSLVHGIAALVAHWTSRVRG